MKSDILPSRPVRYPDSDGRPIADNTEQFEWIVVLKDNLDAMLPDFIAGDLLWYPVEGDNKTRVAPDVLVALGRPSGTARGAEALGVPRGTMAHAPRCATPRSLTVQRRTSRARGLARPLQCSMTSRSWDRPKPRSTP